jgi:hypothetical protein
MKSHKREKFLTHKCERLSRQERDQLKKAF